MCDWTSRSAWAPSGVLVGGVRDAVVLMPLSDPQQPTRVAVNAQSDVFGAAADSTISRRG